MHYAIVGTHHELHRADSADRGLEKKIAAIITGGGVAFVAEEVDANKDVDTFGRELSRKMIGEDRWLSIDVTDGRRKDAGIYDVLEPNSLCPWDFTTVNSFLHADISVAPTG